MKRITTLDDINGKIERWQRRLRRAATAIAKLEGRRKRLLKKAMTATEAVTIQRQQLAPPIKRLEDDASIPAFLARKIASAADDSAKAAIIASRDERKRLKDAGAKARRKAERAGDTKRMPLQGKAALAAIRGE